MPTFAKLIWRWPVVAKCAELFHCVDDGGNKEMSADKSKNLQDTDQAEPGSRQRKEGDEGERERKRKKKEIKAGSGPKEV